MARPTYKKYGITFADARKARVTTITRDDIRKAIPNDDRECAIAQSLRRQQGIEGISVGRTMVYVKYLGKRIVERFALSPDDRRMVKEFDAKGKFQPCTVTLIPPPLKVKIGARTGQKSGTNTRKGRANPANRMPGQRHVRMPG